MTQQLFNVLVCGFEFYINYTLFRNYFKENSKSRFFKLVFLSAIELILFIINSMAGMFFINSVATITLVFCMSLALFEGHVGKKLFLSLVASGISIVSELLTGFAASGLLGTAFETFMGMAGHVMFFTIASKMVQYFTAQIIIATVGKSRYGTSRKESVYLLLCPILAIVNMYTLLYLDTSRQTHTVEHSSIFVLGIGWLAVNIILLKVYEAACERYELAHKLQLIEIQKQAETEYVHRQKMNEQTLRQIMHDIKNQLVNVQNVMRTDTEQGVAYLNQCICSLQDGPNMQITSDYKNLVFNQILNKNKEICERLGIDLVLQINYDDLSFLCVMDTSAIFDNAFDNAIYACNEMPKELKPSILLKVSCSGDMVNITMKNSIKSRPLQDDGRMLSTKTDSVNHGFGLTSIKAAVRNYDGVVLIENSTSEFVLTISLNMNNL